MSSIWSLGSKSNFGFSPQVLSTTLSSSPSPSGTEVSGGLGTDSMILCHSCITSLSSDSSPSSSPLSTFIFSKIPSRSSELALTIALLDTFCSARLSSTRPRSTRRLPSTSISLSTSNSRCFFRTACCTNSLFSLINLMSSIIRYNIITMIRELLPLDFPELLKEIPDAPKQLRYEGELPKESNKLLTIVGSRKYSSYGREICESIIFGLSGSPVTIISGLALGIDSIAHRAALRAGLQTIAIPGSGLDRKVLHPHSHVNLAEEIIENGGGLISEYDDTMPSGAWAFPRRNRIMAGMCHATLIIEAEKKSGTL